MINYIGDVPDEDEVSEEMEMGLELIELLDEHAIVLIPDSIQNKIEKSQSIVASIHALVPMIKKLSKSPYSSENFEHYKLSQKNGEQIEVYLFPKNISGNTYETLAQEMRLIQQANNMMAKNKRVVVGLLV